jgi:hypothetical protein
MKGRLRINATSPWNKMIEILFYFSMANGTGNELLKMMEKFPVDIRVRVFRNWKIFARELISPRTDSAVAVIFISQREELFDAVSIRDLLHEYRLILILPDEEEETISLGHHLRPNFLTFKKGNLQDLEIVLKKMLRLGS